MDVTPSSPILEVTDLSLLLEVMGSEDLLRGNEVGKTDFFVVLQTDETVSRHLSTLIFIHKGKKCLG